MNAAEPIRLLCLPYAGGAASFFRPWRRLGVPGVDIRPIQLPGREERLDEDPYVDIRTAVNGLGPQLRAESGGHPVALFGHSLGAVLAYELARWLCSAGQTVVHVFVSGSPAPGLGRHGRATGLADEEFLGRVREFAGYHHEALDVPELRELILPLLRADVALHEDYRPLPGPALRVPVTCFRGAGDELVTAAESAAWEATTAAGFELVETPGGHMYLVDSAPALLAEVAARLGAAALGTR